MKKTFLFYLGLIGLTIFVGLLSRKIPGLPAGIGDALWAVLIYLGWRLLALPPRWSAGLALLVSYLVEFSQLLTWPWLVAFRATLVGHLLLGQGFLWSDLLAYTLGVLAAVACDSYFSKTKG